MGVNLDQGREGLGRAGAGVQPVAKAAAIGAQLIGDGAGSVGRWAVYGATTGAIAACDGVVRSASPRDRSRGQRHVDRDAIHRDSCELSAGLKQCCRIGFAALGPDLWIPGDPPGQIQKGGIAGGQGTALPARCRGLHQGDAAGLVSRPGGIDAEHTVG
ncbi:MAG: Uncharacterised protein [Synechococcus sp. CC9902]|nr:MAG: Uncharacterised protein [Synechococcus sp. CC9902]